MTSDSISSTVSPLRKPSTGSRKYLAILDTAEQMFGALGFKKASVDDIAVQAGVSKPLIYRYFESKEHLFEVVVDRVINQWCELIVSEGAKVTPSTTHSLRLIIRASLEFALQREVLRGILARESQLMLANYSDVLDRGTNTLREVIVTCLERGVAEGEIRADIELANVAEVITELCVSFVNRLLSSRDSAENSQLLETVIETVLFGVVAKRR